MSRHLTLPVVLSIVAAVGLVPSTAAADDAWATFRGPQGTGRAGQGLPPGDGPLTLDLVWQRSLGSGYSGLSVAGEKLVTAAAAGERDVVVALSTRTSEELWRSDLAPTYPGHDGSHDGPISTPAIAGGRVFVLGPWGHLAAFDLESGEREWALHLVDDLGCELPYYGFGGSPVVVDDLVLLQIGGVEGALAAFDVATGELRWRALADPGSPGAQSPVVAEIAGRRQALVLLASKVAGVDPVDGAVLWDVELEAGMSPMGAMTQSPLPIDENRVFVKYKDGEATVVEVTQDGPGFAATAVVAGLGLARSYSPPTLAGDRLYGYTARFLSAMEPATGDLLWRSREPGDGFLISIGDQLAVLTKKGGLYLGAADSGGWQEADHLELFADLAWTPPSYADGSLYLRSLSEVARVDLKRRQTTLPAAGEAAALPTVLASLVSELAGAGDTAAVVDRFLAERELPLVDGDEVVFLWRGEAEDVAVAGDMIGMRREEPMARLAGTDLWWWATELDSRARINYLFFVDYQPITDPGHTRTASSTVLGPDMNWNRGEPLEMSWLAMPEWPGLELGDAGPAAETAGRLDSIEITLQPAAPEGGETPEPVRVAVQVWLPPGYDEGSDRYPVVYVQHPAAREAGRWPQALDRVVGDTVAPLIAVFPDAPRMRGFGDLFVEQLVPQIDERYRTRAERESRANVGMGWPGFATTSMAFRNPDVFGLLGVQSLYLLTEQMGIVAQAIGEADASSLPMKIYLEWGRWDLVSPHEQMDMRASSRWAWDLLSDKGWQPIGGEVWDSTDFASWSNRTDVLLEALFPMPGSTDTLAAWQTGR